MQLVDVFVLFCMILGVLSAALVALHPNILHAAVALVFALLSLAGVYGALGADFLAAVQLIIYVGGIIVVILFAVMMSENIDKTNFFHGAKKFLWPFLGSLIILFGLLRLLYKTPWQKVPTFERISTVEGIGWALVGPYALVFQYVAIVLLSGLIGAVVVARPIFTEEPKQEADKP